MATLLYRFYKGKLVHQVAGEVIKKVKNLVYVVFKHPLKLPAGRSSKPVAMLGLLRVVRRAK